jgi:hypothetical protein
MLFGGFAFGWCYADAPERVSATMGEQRKTYRCFLRTDQGHIAGVEEVEAASDEEAKARALVLLRASNYPSGEIWDLDRLVGSVTR